MEDRFHDRTGFRDSLIYPGSGNNFIYGAGGFDEVFYEQGSRFDYQITVVDDRTVEVYYKPDDTTDTLIDVEAINFEGADELVENPFYRGNDPEKAYTTFTLQVTKEDNWSQPPFIFSPFTYFVPFGTTEISLTKDLLLSNVYDPQGNEDQLEISYIDVYTYSNSNPELDTTDPSADIWEVTIPEGLNDGIEPVVIDYFVDKGFSSQGNFLEIYPSTKLSYISAKAAIDLRAFGESESMEATEFDDTLSSGSGDDTLKGNNGNDLLNGEDGNDSLDGGEGNDSLNGGIGNDNILGEEGNDFLEGNDGEDILEGNNGNDTLNGGAGKDLLLGGDGDDT
ncbi:MAG: calcium-binding protein [Xenococcaceae cyanobacterium MO_167.B27]|nr:calcium-binding protein [Xenococcaceae cyanobacterium MO_167.B27]